MRGWPLPLALRLTAWYAATAFLLVVGAVWIQYRALSTDLAQEDDELLLQTMTAVQSGFLASSWSDAIPSALGPLVRDLDSHCRVVGGDRQPQLPPPRCDAPPPPGADGAFRTWYSPARRQWRVLSTYVATPTPHWVDVMLDRWTDDQVLAGYRRKLGFVLPAALLLSALVGYGVARRGLAPLAALTARVSKIELRTLGQRLSVDGGPPEVRALIVSCDAMLERLDVAFSTLTQCSIDLAHELRTPLHVLRQQAEVALRQPRSPEEYRDVLGSGLEELDRLGSMVHDILFLARTEDPRAGIQRAHFAVADELTDVAEFFEADAIERDVAISCDVPPALEISADRMLLRRALVNVVTNAVRHTPAGGSVALSARRQPGAVVVEVRDTGDGIAPDLLPHVFNRYVRANGAATSHAEAAGAGLGLSIVRGIMSLHGGTAAIASAPSRGTCVSLSFPLSTTTNLTEL